MPLRAAVTALIALAVALPAIAAATGSSSAPKACIDVRQAGPISLSGTLTRRLFHGPPGEADSSARPEAAYILRLDRAICIDGDDFVEVGSSIERVQVFPAHPGADAALFRTMRRHVGRHVTVDGSSAFGAHTAHHHAPLLLPITRIEPRRAHR